MEVSTEFIANSGLISHNVISLEPGPSETSTLLLASNSNYQSILNGTHLPALSYPESLAEIPTSKRTSQKMGEKGRRSPPKREEQKMHVDMSLRSPIVPGSSLEVSPSMQQNIDIGFAHQISRETIVMPRYEVPGASTQVQDANQPEKQDSNLKQRGKITKKRQALHVLCKARKRKWQHNEEAMSALGVDSMKGMTELREETGVDAVQNGNLDWASGKTAASKQEADEPTGTAVDEEEMGLDLVNELLLQWTVLDRPTLNELNREAGMKEIRVL